MPTRREAQSRFVQLYYSRVLSSGQAFDHLDLDFPHIANAINSLRDASSGDQAKLFLDFLQALSPYLQARKMSRVLLEYCETGLQAAARLGTSLGWLYLLKHQANWALGQWQASLPDLGRAIDITRDVAPAVHARALLALGAAQMNQGQYRAAVATLSSAEESLAGLNDYAGVAACKAEIAAYHLNRSDYARALVLFQQLADYERRTDPDGVSVHTAFMLGVMYRRVKKYELSIQELSELIRRSEKRRDLGTVATASHHLAWALFECDQIAEAERLAWQAKAWYDRVGDLRGSSDADEQLGVLALARHDLVSAQAYLKQSLSVREQIGNRHGAASSLRRLARCHLVQGDFRRGLASIGASLVIYYRLGVLTRPRIFNIFQELLRGR